ncbi:SUN domain-containing protein 1-like [Bicyclus anynana]|uniref:SUN domain-containing protein 1-like n=1 Tax=Bicyclus anynana TaxID=110368 RepID=A0A6J1P6C6_BICAN|nr:SUN domain-containing protein 1-like [Bicyclus anynana]
MDYPHEHESCFRHVFRSFVCVVLSLLLGMQVYTYFIDPQEAMEGDFTDVKYMVLQLTRGLSEVNRKHENLQGQMERISQAMPALAAAAGRAKDALEPSRRGVRQFLDMQDYDRQMIDYALETAGGRVVDTGGTLEHIVFESPVSWMLHMLSSTLCRECPEVNSILRPGNLPGECWAFRGARGEATIRLLGTVHVNGVSLEHIPPHISATREISSAPRLFQLEGLEFRGDPYPHDFGTFEYDKEGKPIQYFEVLHPSPKGFNLVRVKIYSNWGHIVYTCVYRVRIHGELVSDQVRPTVPPKDDDMRIENE